MVGVGKHQTMKMQVHVMGNLSTLLLLLPINMFMCFVATVLPTMLRLLYASIALVHLSFYCICHVSAEFIQH
jgi:hypothetical protein